MARATHEDEPTLVMPAPAFAFDHHDVRELEPAPARPSLRWLRAARGPLARERAMRREITVDAVLSLPTGRKYAFQTVNLSPTGLLLGARAGQSLPLQPGLWCSIRLIWDLHVIDLETELVRIVHGAAGPEGAAQGFAFVITRADAAQLALYQKLLTQATHDASASPSRAVERTFTAKRIALLLSALACLALVGLKIHGSMQPVSVQLTPVSRGTISELVSSSADGEVVSMQRALLRVTGSTTSVLEVPVSRGSRVKAGDLLVHLDEGPLLDAKRHAEAELQVARAQQRKASGQAWRAATDLSVDHQLERSGSVSAADVRRREGAARAADDAARVAAMSVQAAQAVVVARTNELARARVVAPFDGIVADVFVRPGDSVAPGASLVDIANDDTLAVHAPFDESDATQIAPGMQARVLAPGRKDAIMGTVLAVAPVVRVDAKGARSVLVEVELPKDAGLRLGGTANVDVVVRTEPDSLQIPAQALMSGPDGKSVYAVEGGRLKRVVVTTKLASVDTVAIEPGPLAEASLIAADPSDPAVKEGARVVRP